MEFEVAAGVLAWLMLAAFAAGFVDAIAGGGGLITVPALILAGAPPVTALATNKLQGLFGAGSAAVAYARAGHVSPGSQIGAAALAFGAAALGTALTTRLPTDLIRLGLPFLLIALALFFALKPGLDDRSRAERMRPALFAATMVPLIGFYDGLVGPGAGAFYLLAFVLLGGFGLLAATARTKFLNFASNTGSMAAFALIAAPWWLTGLAMGAAQVAGAALGARLAIRIGARIIRPLLVVTATALALRLLWDQP